jgi:YD repeat-containing protein
LVGRRQGVALSHLDWDTQNRLTTVRTHDERTVRMTYDALGRRRIKTVDGEQTFYAWDGDARISERHKKQPAREHVYYPGTFEYLSDWNFEWCIGHRRTQTSTDQQSA